MRRQITITVVLLLAAGLTALAFSQEGEKVLRPAPDANSLIEKLADDSFQVRTKAEADLIVLGEKAVPALTEAAREHPDTHVRFAAERILHRIRAKGERKEKPLEERRLLREMDDGFRDFEDLLRRLEERGVRLRDWLEDDFGQRERDLDERVGELEDNLRKELDLSERSLERVFRGRVKGAVESDGERLEYEQSEDGRVTVKVTTEGETKTYEAESLDALKEAHPEVHEKVRPFLGGVRWFGVGPRGAFRLRLPPFGGAFPDPVLPPRDRDENRPAPGGFRLGIWVGEIGEPLRAHLRLEPGLGILVEDVVPGSLADRIGVQRFDVVRTANGEKVGSAEDVRRVLATLPEGGKVELSVIRGGEPLKLYGNR